MHFFLEIAAGLYQFDCNKMHIYARKIYNKNDLVYAKGQEVPKEAYAFWL